MRSELPVTFCPDCEQDIPTDEFIAHREREHPPGLHVISGVGGITSEEAVHGSSPHEE
jgi:hypothetical protein